MLSKITSFALNGLEGVPVEVETDVNKGRWFCSLRFGSAPPPPP